MTYAAAGNKATADRIVRAQVDFAGTLMQFAGISKADAEKVTAFYLKKKLAKLDAVMGVINVKHGAYLDRDVILRAVDMAG